MTIFSLRRYWLAAIAIWGVGDIAVSIYAFYGIAPESHFAYLFILGLFDFLRPFGFFYQLLTALSLWKICALVIFYLLYRFIPWPYRAGVPIGLTLLGMVVVVNNLLVIAFG